MNDIATREHMSGRYILKVLLLILIPQLAARVLYVAYSYAATDVTASAFLESALDYGARTFSCLTIGTAYASIQHTVYRYAPARGFVPLGIYAGVILLDDAARFFIDYLGGAINYRELVALISLSAEFFSTVAIAFGGWILGVAIHHLYVIRSFPRKHSERSAVNASLLLYFAVPLIRWIVNTFSFLVSVEWIATVDETRSIVTDGVSIVVFYAIITFIGSRIALAALHAGEKD